MGRDMPMLRGPSGIGWIEGTVVLFQLLPAEWVVSAFASIADDAIRDGRGA